MNSCLAARGSQDPGGGVHATRGPPYRTSLSMFASDLPVSENVLLQECTYLVVRTPFPSPSIFAPFKGLYSSLFHVAQHYLSVAVATRACAQIPLLLPPLLRSFFLRRRTSFLLPSPSAVPLPSLVLPSSPPFFLMQTNFTVEMNCSENEDRTAAAAELKHILAFRVPPSHAFRFET